MQLFLLLKLEFVHPQVLGHVPKATRHQNKPLSYYLPIYIHIYTILYLLPSPLCFILLPPGEPLPSQCFCLHRRLRDRAKPRLRGLGAAADRGPTEMLPSYRSDVWQEPQQKEYMYKYSIQPIPQLGKDKCDSMQCLQSLPGLKILKFYSMR